MTNTERLIADVEHSAKHGAGSLTFLVGRYTGNGSSVVAALRRRGYRVERAPAGGTACYRLYAKTSADSSQAKGDQHG